MSKNHIKIDVGSIEHLVHETTLKKLYIIYYKTCYKMSIIPEDRFEEEKWLKHFSKIANTYQTYKLFKVLKVILGVFLFFLSLTVNRFIVLVTGKEHIELISNGFILHLNGLFLTISLGAFIGYSYAKLLFVLSSILKENNP